jgi:hypothetical protein
MAQRAPVIRVFVSLGAGGSGSAGGIGRRLGGRWPASGTLARFDGNGLDVFDPFALRPYQGDICSDRLNSGIGDGDRGVWVQACRRRRRPSGERRTCAFIGILRVGEKSASRAREQTKEAPLAGQAQAENQGEHEYQLFQQGTLLPARYVAGGLPDCFRQGSDHTPKLGELTAQAVLPVADAAKHAGDETVLLQWDGGGRRGGRCCSGGAGRCGCRGCCHRGGDGSGRPRRNRLQGANRFGALMFVLQHLNGAARIGW